MLTLNKEDYLTPGQVADFLGISKETLSQMRTRGDGPSWIQMNAKKVLYHQSDVIAWMEGKRRVVNNQTRTMALPVSGARSRVQSEHRFGRRTLKSERR